MFLTSVYYSIALCELYNVVKFIYQREQEQYNLKQLRERGNNVLCIVCNTLNMVYDSNTVVYDKNSYQMPDFMFNKYLRFLQQVPSDSIIISQYPIFSLYNLLFSKRFFLFHPPHTKHIYVVKNLFINRLFVFLCMYYLFPIQLKFFLGLLFCFNTYYHR